MMSSDQCIPPSASADSRSSSIRWDCLRLFVAILLVTAAIVKTVNQIEILSGNGLLSSSPLLLFVVGFETFLATHLLIGGPQLSWRLVIVTFSAFAVASSYAVIDDGLRPRATHVLGTGPVGWQVLAVSI